MRPDSTGRALLWFAALRDVVFLLFKAIAPLQQKDMQVTSWRQEMYGADVSARYRKGDARVIAEGSGMPVSAGH
jgi:hypothetical protein